MYVGPCVADMAPRMLRAPAEPVDDDVDDDDTEVSFADCGSEVSIATSVTSSTPTRGSRYSRVSAVDEHGHDGPAEQAAAQAGGSQRVLVALVVTGLVLFIAGDVCC